MLENGQFQKVNDFSKGLISNFKPEEITSKGSPDLENVRIFGVSIGSRRGFSKLGASISAGNQIRDLNWFRSPDTLVAVTDSKLYYWDATNETWNQVSFTTGEGFSVDAETNSTNWREVMFMANGTDELGMLFAPTLDENITTATTDFDVDVKFWDLIPTAGKLTIGTDEIDYTGKSHDTATGITNLTGVTNIGESHSDGDRCYFYVEPTVDLSSGLPTGATLASGMKYCATWAEKLWVAGISSAPSTLFYSVTATGASPDNIYDFASSGSGHILVGTGGEITGLVATRDFLVIFKKDSIYYINDIDLESATPTPQLQTVNEGEGAVSQKSIAIVEKDVIYFTGRDVKKLGPEENIDGLLVNSLAATAIEESFKSLDDDQTRAMVIYNPIEREVRLFATELDDTFNGTGYVLDLDRGAWLKDTGKVAAAGTMWNNRLYFGSGLDSEIFLDDDDFVDDGAQYAASFYTKEFDFGVPEIKKIYREIYITGGLSDITTLEVEVYVDGEFKRKFSIDEDDIVTSGGEAIGFKTFGVDSAFGTTTADTNLYLFRKKLSLRDSGYKIQLRFVCDGIGYRFEIRNYQIGYLLRDAKASTFSTAT